jgi:hypothetical protein
MSKLLKPLVARLRQYSLAELERIADAAGVAPSIPRHIRNGRKNPTLNSIEPLIIFFEKADSGEIDLPAVLAPAQPDKGAP